MRRAFKFRAYPTRPQEGRAVRLLADHCDLYNAALEERREAWRMHRVSVSYGMQSAQLREIRRADPHGQGRHSFTAQQQTLRRLNVVFEAFYARVKKKEKAGYPRFRPYSRFHQVRFVAGDGAKWIAAPPGGWARVAFQGVGSVKVRQHRSVRHKTARALVSAYDMIALEKLKTAGMTRRPAPKPDPDQAGAFLPNSAAAKAALNKAILDAGWAQFASILAAKAESAGRRTVFVNPAGTSITCHQCGRRCIRPRQVTVVCPTHGTIDADVNGARNIVARAGLGSGQVLAA